MINMQIVFLGTSSFKDKVKDITYNTLYLSKDNKGLLLNCTDDIVSQLSNNNISIDNINSVIIINTSNVKGLNVLDKMLKESFNVYVPFELLSTLPKFKHLNILELKENILTNIKNYKVTKAQDNIIIDDVLYANTISTLSTLNAISKTNVLILNSNDYFNTNNVSVEQSLNCANKYLPNTVILTDINTTYPSYELSLKNINLYWDRIKVSDNVNVKLAYDSMVYDTVDLGYVPGVYLNKKTIDFILSAKKDILTRTTCFKDLLGKELLLMDDKCAYGTIKFNRPTKCDSDNLHKLSNYSKIIHDYSTANIPLLLHKFDFVRFDEPKLVVYNQKSYFQEYIPNVCVTQRLLKDINTYDKSIKSSETLLNDHRMAHMYYDIAQSGKKSKFSTEDIINLHKLISTELKSRNLTHNIINKLDKYNLSDTDKMFDVVHDFTDSVLIKDVVSLLNSDDGLLQFAFKDLTATLKDTLTDSISKQFNNKLNIELLSHDDNCISDKYVPVYDLVLLKRNPKIVRLKQSKFETFESFIPTTAKSFTDLEKLIKELW